MTERITLAQLQKEHAPWAKHNFGEAPAHQPLLGLVEELSELIEPCEEYFHQSKKWKDVSGVIADSLADIVIFGCDYANRMDWGMEEVERRAAGCSWGEHMSKYANEAEFHDEAKSALLSLAQAIGKMSHHHLKAEQKIRGSAETHREKGMDEFVMVMAITQTLCTMFGFDMVDLYSSVWAQVKKRDWTKTRKQA